MNRKLALEILRLDRLEKQARIYGEKAQRSGNLARGIRAANLETAAYSKGMSIVMDEVTSYCD